MKRQRRRNRQVRPLLSPCEDRVLLSGMAQTLGLAPAAETQASVWSSRPIAPQGNYPLAEATSDNSVLVRYHADDSASAAQLSKTLNGLGGYVNEVLDGEIHVVVLGPGVDPRQAARSLSRLPGVDYAEPNDWVTIEAIPNDPSYTNGTLWGMYGDASAPANSFGSQASEAWAAGNTGSSSVYVAIIDEGIDFNHPDLAANIWTNPYDPIDGADNDGNGYIDDIHGWDFNGNNNSIYDGSSTNSVDAHGTHVAGTIGGVGNNGVGVVGVNWNVKVISGKFLGPSGGTTAAAIRAIDYVTDLKVRHGLNIVATNNSWGGGGYSQAMHEAILRAAKQNILFIAAAGNSKGNNDRKANYPSNYSTLTGTSNVSAASYEAVVAVAAIDNVGGLASFSNYGATTVDLGAPGVNIYSTLPGNTYGSYSGTSMATPHVTGGAALYAAANPGASGSQIRAALLNNTIATSSLNKKTITGGRLNVSSFV